jgi:hypothetical protein
MRNRRWLQLTLAVVVALGLAGCINYDQDLQLNPDGSGKLIMHYSLSQQLVSMMSMGGESQSSEGGKDMPFKLKEDEVRKDLEAPGVTVDKFETKTENELQHFYVHVSFNNVTSLNQTKTFREMPFEWITQGNTVEFRQLLKGKEEKKAEGDAGDEAGKQMAQAMFGNAAFKYKVKLPSKVLPAPDTNGKIAEDGQTVSWEFPVVDLGSSDKLMTAKFNTGGSMSVMMYIILGGAGLLTLIGFIIVIMFVRKP